MKFSIGDKIVLKQTGEEGVVTAYINQQMIEVSVNGTTFPVYQDEIDHPYLKWFTEKKAAPVKKSVPEQLPVEKEKFRKPRLPKGIYLSFLPVFKADVFEDIVDHIKIYLLNELPYTIRYKYDVRFGNESEFKHESSLHNFGHVFLHSIPYDDMNDQPRFHWMLANAENETHQPEENILRIRPSKLFEHINHLLQNNEPTFSYLLIDDFRVREKPAPKEKVEPVLKPAFVAQSLSSLKALPSYELDLHMEHLVDDVKGMTNADMLNVQLNTLRKALDNALLNRQERMVIIHGLGKGVLKEEVHKILKRTKHVKRFSNDYHCRYGFGATEVFFSY